MLDAFIGLKNTGLGFCFKEWTIWIKKTKYVTLDIREREVTLSIIGLIAWVKNRAEYFTCIIWFNPWNNSPRQLWLSIWQWRKLLSNLSKVIAGYCGSWNSTTRLPDVKVLESFIVSFWLSEYTQEPTVVGIKHFSVQENVEGGHPQRRAGPEKWVLS